MSEISKRIENYRSTHEVIAKLFDEYAYRTKVLDDYDKYEILQLMTRAWVYHKKDELDSLKQSQKSISDVIAAIEENK